MAGKSPSLLQKLRLSDEKKDLKKFKNKKASIVLQLILQV